VKTHEKKARVMAIAAHPDDIEFMMAGTLLLLGKKGYELHYMTLSSGNCGSMTMRAAKTKMVRRKESIAAARILGAIYHGAIANDLEIFYELRTLRRLAAVIRDVSPQIILTHSPQDYMEDHTNTSRLVVTAAFSRGMPNFKTTPQRKHVSDDTVIYHAMPHGLRDQVRRPVAAEIYVNTGSAHARKRKALAAHQSQRAWLDKTQGMDSYLAEMDAISRAVGKMSQRFEHAEGWRRHLHLGFSAREFDPLREVLGASVRLNERYNAPSE
jgi:N-acetylglucosamine malate deacetylase 1